ncbi:cadmium zinc-transporting ATPase [Asimina triloba]
MTFLQARYTMYVATISATSICTINKWICATSAAHLKVALALLVTTSYLPCPTHCMLLPAFKPTQGSCIGTVSEGVYLQNLGIHDWFDNFPAAFKQGLPIAAFALFQVLFCLSKNCECSDGTKAFKGIRREPSMASDKFQKSYFDVLGICCSSEVTLIEKILKPLEGVQKVSVIVPTRTVIVVHDNLLISQIQIVKALNKARLEANIRVFGEDKKGRNWPSPWTIASGILLAISFLKFLYHPLHWIALAATVVGLPPVLMRSYAALKSVSLDINILALIAGIYLYSYLLDVFTRILSDLLAQGKKNSFLILLGDFAVAGTIALRDYTEAGSIVFLFTIAHWLESRASHKLHAHDQPHPSLQSSYYKEMSGGWKRDQQGGGRDWESL